MSDYNYYYYYYNYNKIVVKIKNKINTISYYISYIDANIYNRAIDSNMIRNYNKNEISLA